VRGGVGRKGRGGREGNEGVHLTHFALRPSICDANAPWLLLNVYRMSASIKPKRTAMASRGFLATARLSCFIGAVYKRLEVLT